MKSPTPIPQSPQHTPTIHRTICNIHAPSPRYTTLPLQSFAIQLYTYSRIPLPPAIRNRVIGLKLFPLDISPFANKSTSVGRGFVAPSQLYVDSFDVLHYSVILLRLTSILHEVVLFYLLLSNDDRRIKQSHRIFDSRVYPLMGMIACLFVNLSR